MENTKSKMKRGTPEHRAFMKGIGQRGGQANVAKHGKVHMGIIGLRGGLALKQQRGLEHFSELGKIGSKKQWGDKEEKA